MSAEDKIKNTAEHLGGKAKETAGKATGNERLEAEGKTDQAASQLKKTVEDVKDFFKN